MTRRIGAERIGSTVFRAFCNPVLRKATLRSVKIIIYRFFFLQYKAAFLPGRIPVTPVDHPLDKDIPFSPKWVDIYLDFVAFWVRMVGFLLTCFGRKATGEAENFITSMGRLYQFASSVYQKNLSTTKRPFHGTPRFVMIYAADPHLMCIPSLHVMIVIHTYTQFRAIAQRAARKLGKETELTAQIEELYRGALDITEAILYVKQHSVNCVPAALYTMTCFSGELFGEAEARRFASDLFREPLSPEKSDTIRAYILWRYDWFLRERRAGEDWRGPLLRFLGDSEEIVRQ
jgi:hypothetical protein